MMPVRLLRATLLALGLFAGTALAQPGQPQMFDRLHGALHLTPGQEDSWKTFQQAYAIAPDEIARRRGASAALATLSAPQRVDQSISLMKADLDAQEKRGAALKAFYANLSPQQQGIFDRETLPPPMDRGD